MPPPRVVGVIGLSDLQSARTKILEAEQRRERGAWLTASPAGAWALAIRRLTGFCIRARNLESRTRSAARQSRRALHELHGVSSEKFVRAPGSPPSRRFPTCNA